MNGINIGNDCYIAYSDLLEIKKVGAVIFENNYWFLISYGGNTPQYRCVFGSRRKATIHRNRLIRKLENLVHKIPQGDSAIFKRDLGY